MTSPRPWKVQREICARILRGDNDQDIVLGYSLTAAELAAFKIIADEIVTSAIKKRSVFKQYATFRRKRPERLLSVLLVSLTFASLVFLGILLARVNLSQPGTYPLISACATIFAVVAAVVGWTLGGWISYRNARLQHTINLVSTRFTQQTFISNFTAFHKQFGYDPARYVTKAELDRLAQTGQADDLNAAQAVRFILNYYEFIAFCASTGDVDMSVIENTIKGNLKFYYDKCAPLILSEQSANPRTMEHYSRLRDSFRDP